MSFYKICIIYQRTLHFGKLRANYEILCTLDGEYEEQCTGLHWALKILRLNHCAYDGDDKCKCKANPFVFIITIPALAHILSVIPSETSNIKYMSS